MKLVEIAVIVDPDEVVHFCDSNWVLISCWADRENFSVINPMGFSLHLFSPKQHMIMISPPGEFVGVQVKKKKQSLLYRNMMEISHTHKKKDKNKCL